jgi:hypothetical protein
MTLTYLKGRETGRIELLERGEKVPEAIQTPLKRI